MVNTIEEEVVEKYASAVDRIKSLTDIVGGQPVAMEPIYKEFRVSSSLAQVMVKENLLKMEPYKGNKSRYTWLPTQPLSRETIVNLVTATRAVMAAHKAKSEGRKKGSANSTKKTAPTPVQKPTPQRKELIEAHEPGTKRIIFDEPREVRINAVVTVKGVTRIVLEFVERGTHLKIYTDSADNLVLISLRSQSISMFDNFVANKDMPYLITSA